MEPLAIVLITIGALATLIGSIMALVAAFRENVWWGLAYLFIPLASLVFVCMHWARAKAGFLVSLLGGLLMLSGVFSSPTVRQMITSLQSLDPAKFAAGLSAPGPDLDARIQDKRDRLEMLEAQFASQGAILAKRFQELTAKRQALKADDAPSIAAFNSDAAQYQALNAAHQQLPGQIAAGRAELDALLDERTRQKVSAPAVGGKRVVMYTTASCPACVAAKSYFARKGVPYEEHDVNASPTARAEFQRLGGRGVPLILVGSEKMEGFSEQRLNQLL